MLFYDLETSFSRKRKDALIIEIGAVRGERTFHRLVNPIPPGENLRSVLKTQDHKKTYRWWKKLLGEKGYLINDMESLENTILGFTPEGEAVQELILFGEGLEFCAHNGKCFDHPILSSALAREGLDPPPFLDSLPMLRRSFDFPKNSLGYLYAHLFEESFRAHHALDDAQALKRVVESCALRKGTTVRDLWERTVPLESIRGIGRATKLKIQAEGLENAEQLLEWVKEHDSDDWRDTFSHLHRYKKLGKYLYGKRW